MTFDRRGLLLLALAVIVVAALAQLSRLERTAEGQGGESEAVFTPMRVSKLTDDSLVDALISLPLEPRLDRVGWDHDILSVDLKLGAGEGSEQTIRTDSEELVRLAFGQVSNVKQLLIRVFLEADGKKTLLLAADSRQSDWVGVPKEAASDGAEALWEEKLRPVWTPAGERWRRNFAKS